VSFTYLVSTVVNPPTKITFVRDIRTICEKTASDPQLHSFPSDGFEGLRENGSKSMLIYAFYSDFSAPSRYITLCSKRCISETAVLICKCDTPLERLLNGLIEGKFISHRDAMSNRRARPTAIDVPLVFTLLYERMTIL